MIRRAVSQRTGGQTWTAAVGNRAEETTGMCEERSCPEEGQSEGGNPPEFEAVKDDGYANDAPARSVGGVAGGSKTGLSGWKGVIGRRESIFLALLVFLFGDNIVSRIAGWGAPKDSGNHADDPPRPIMNRRFHATYSFRKAPFVHPKIVDDLIGNLSDTGEQVVAINLLDSQDSNRYFGEILVAPQADPMEPSWPWVYSVEGEGSDDQRSGEFWGREFYAYRYLGSTRNGLDVLHARHSGGGSGVFNRVVFVRTEADQGVEYPLLRNVDSRREAARPELRERELVRIVGKIPLGDRWLGTIEVVGDDVVVRGRDLAERCEYGGVTTMEAVEMDHFMDIDCKEGAPDRPPAARVYKALATG